MKLNVGCGRDVRDGWINIDRMALPGVDHVVELDDPDKVTIPLPDDSVDEFALSHILEHIHHPLPLMAELWRVARDGARCEVRCPYGSSDDADEDPTHVRRMFPNSFAYFGQGAYWRADYGYRADWDVTGITLAVPEVRYAGATVEQIAGDVMSLRNVVVEMRAELVAVKPARTDAEFPAPTVSIELVR